MGEKPRRSLRNTLVLVLAIAALPLLLALRAWAFLPFKMPSGSMYPTMEVGDHFFAAGAAYGFFSKGLPGRGDVIVFLEPYAQGQPEHFVKRVIGLPGDIVAFPDGHPTINGWRVPNCRVGSLATAEGETELFVEFLEGRAYLAAFLRDLAAGGDGARKVAEGEVFVVGDNRFNSADSRTWNGGRGGGLPVGNVVGRVGSLWYPFARFGTSLQSEPVLPESAGALQPALDKCLREAPSIAQTIPPRAR